MVNGERREPIMVLLLSFVTCNIYGIYWHWKVGEEIRAALGKPDAVNPALALFSIICPPIMLYYIYTLDNAMQELAPKKGVQYSSNFILWLLLCLLGVGYFVEMFMLQDKLNDVWAADAPVV